MFLINPCCHKYTSGGWKNLKKSLFCLFRLVEQVDVKKAELSLPLELNVCPTDAALLLCGCLKVELDETVVKVTVWW